MKILLAEDDLRLGKMLKTILSKNGINVNGLQTANRHMTNVMPTVMTFWCWTG